MAAIFAGPETKSCNQLGSHAEKLSLLPSDPKSKDSRATTASEAKFITSLDPVIQTKNGGRLPAVPVDEAVELNRLKARVEIEETGGNNQDHGRDPLPGFPFAKLDSLVKEQKNPDIVSDNRTSQQITDLDASLRNATPPSKTNPLFPQLPLYGPPSLLRNLQCIGFRTSSFFLSLAFLGTIVLGSIFTSIPLGLKNIWLRVSFRNPDAQRPFYEEEQHRENVREVGVQAWKPQQKLYSGSQNSIDGSEEDGIQKDRFEPTEGGRDKLVCDVGYYARRVGLDVEEFEVQTEDGFILVLWHIYNPSEYTPLPTERRTHRGPEVFPADHSQNTEIVTSGLQQGTAKRKYPVLLIHGLLQSAGAYCVTDDDSLAFYLCKSGYDVWLGNNRCGFQPRHTLLSYGDPRMWNWNIRQMAVFDIPALVSRVLLETSFAKLGLVCHSQGTTETFVALAKGQRPDLGNKISVFCALAPAVYAGPLIGKAYFKFMRAISPNMFRMVFGIHAFIPFMMTMHALLPGRIYGALGYRVFSFLFNWTDDRWDRGLRNRMFQFSPVYVSSESMRWWLGRECFARHKCILATRDEAKLEDAEDAKDEKEDSSKPAVKQSEGQGHENHPTKGRNAWYNEQVPPFALWVAGADELVDGRRLLRRFEKGREPHVQVVHAKVIEGYEHLDVIWAIDSVDQVAREVREVVWKTAPADARRVCRTPVGCEMVEIEENSG